MKLLKPLSVSDRKWLRRSRRILLIGLILFFVGLLINPSLILADLTSVTIASGTQYTTRYGNQKKVCRTSDETIHTIVLALTATTLYHYLSRDGLSFSGSTISTKAGPGSLFCGVDDNLYFAGRNDTSIKDAVLFKGTVNKTASPWTWIWAYVTTRTMVNDILSSGVDLTVDNNLHISLTIGTVGADLEWHLYNGTAWSITALPTGSVIPLSSIIHDSANNLYVSMLEYTSGLLAAKMWKITYTASPESWSVGASQTVTTSTNVNTLSLVILDDDRIAFSFNYETVLVSSLIFRKSTAPRDITSWGAEVTLESSGIGAGAGGTYHATMAISSAIIRVYYIGTWLNANGDLFYKESTDGGISWGSRSTITDDSTVQNYINADGNSPSVDYVWQEGVGPTYTVKYAARMATGGTTTTTTTTTIPSAADLTGVCSGVGAALGIADEAGCMLVSFILFFMILVPLGMLTKNFWVILITGLTFAGFLTAIQWLPVWIMIMLCLIVALMLGSRLTGLTSRGGSDEGD